MSAIVHDSVDYEPSNPQERANNQLPPKSYAEAIVEGTEKHAGQIPQEANAEATVEENEKNAGQIPQEADAEDTVEGTEEHAGQIPQKANGVELPNGKEEPVEVNGLKRNIDDDRVVYANHTSPNGEKLTSIKPDEEGLKHDARVTPRQKGRAGKKLDRNDAKLASGRRAGAGWQRSA